MMTSSALRLLAARVATTKVKTQRCEDRREHAQGGAQRVFGQVARIERDRRNVEPFERRAHLVRAMGDRRKRPGDQDEHDDIVEIGIRPRRPRPSGGRRMTPETKRIFMLLFADLL